MAYKFGKFLGTLATPPPIKDWSRTTHKEKLLKIAAKVVSHGRYVASQMAAAAPRSSAKCRVECLQRVKLRRERIFRTSPLLPR